MNEALAANPLPESDFRERNREEFGFPYKFSIVTAVYNVEPFLREAIDSVLAQDIGFEENVQLILVDDGSPDGSGAICDEYAERYPENIKVIHKENGGVSSARNEGLKYAEGRYLNFMDSDDKFTKNVLSRVYRFFTQHEEETDVVAVPRFYFDGKTGAHDLNYRFKNGTRLIDLRKDYTAIQNTSSTAFFTRAGIDGVCYETNLAYCEDTLFVCMILLKKMKIGVVKNGAHYTRKRLTGELSATQKMENDKNYYLATMEYFTKRVIQHCIQHYGYVPCFVQFLLMYELQWKLISQKSLCPPLSEEEYEKYLNDFHDILQHIDNEIIFSQKKMNQDFKIFCLKCKYQKEPEQIEQNGNILFHYGNFDVVYLSKVKCHLDFLTIEKGNLLIEGCILCPIQNLEFEVGININDVFYPCERVDRNEEKYSFGISIRKTFGFKLKFPLKNLKAEGNIVKICCKTKNGIVVMKNVLFGRYTAVFPELQHSYFYAEGWKLTLRHSVVIVERMKKKESFRAEIKLLHELWQKNRVGSRKAAIARLAYRFFKTFKRKEIWLITDRIEQAGDNGQAFFEYLVNHHPSNEKIYFVIKKKTDSGRELGKKGRIVSPSTWRYKLLFLLADKVISSQADDIILNPFGTYESYYRDLTAKHQFVFLQHGVIKDDLSDWLNRYNKNISLFVTTANREYQSILDYPYYYGEEVVKLTGLPRYDLLYHDEKKYITIMPSWRAYLVTGIDPHTGKRSLKMGFKNSQYYQMYSNLLNCSRLFDAAEKMGYQIRLLNHPNMANTEDEITYDPRLSKLEKSSSYRTIFAESALLITDYSSTAFDFTYLRKPVIYYQADADEFFSGIHTYQKGYFDYEQDGFGEVEYDLESTVDRIIEYMENDCQLKEKYRERIDSFFAFNDLNNCKRVYEAVKELPKN